MAEGVDNLMDEIRIVILIIDGSDDAVFVNMRLLKPPPPSCVPS